MKTINIYSQYLIRPSIVEKRNKYITYQDVYENFGITAADKYLHDIQFRDNASLGFTSKFKQNDTNNKNKAFAYNLFCIFLFQATLKHSNSTLIFEQFQKIPTIDNFFAWCYQPQHNRIVYCIYGDGNYLFLNHQNKIIQNQFSTIDINKVEFIIIAEDKNCDFRSINNKLNKKENIKSENPILAIKKTNAIEINSNSLQNIDEMINEMQLAGNIGALKYLDIPISNEEENYFNLQYLYDLEYQNEEKEVYEKIKIQPFDNLHDCFYINTINKTIREFIAKTLYEKLLNKYESFNDGKKNEPLTPTPIDDFSNIWQPYTEPFKGFKELEKIISSWTITIKNEEVAKNRADFLRENIDNILQLKKTMEKLEKTKLTPENKKTFDAQHKFVKTQMTFNDIVPNNKKLEELYTLNQTQYPIWLKEQKEINKNRRNKILKFTIIIGVLALLPILYSNYDYEIKDFFSNLFDKKTTAELETEATEIPTEEVATEVDPTNVPVVDSAVSASAEIKEVENEIINIHGEQFTYTGKVIKGDSGGYIPYQYGWAIFDDGSKYIGKYEYGYRTGLGYITYKSGAEYGGEFYHNSFDGLGKYIYPNGSYYIGEFTNYKNNINGCGRYYDNKDKLILEGLFENGKISKEKSCNIDYDHILKIYNEASVVKK